MSLTVLKPKIPQPTNVTPQCCVKVDPPTHNSMWRRDRYETRKAKDGTEWKADQCQRPSTILIDGQPYCRIHAGQKALEKWLHGELVERKLEHD